MMATVLVDDVLMGHSFKKFRNAGQMFQAASDLESTGGHTPSALATVVGVLIEVPVMLSVVKIVNSTRDWYEAGDAVERNA